MTQVCVLNYRGAMGYFRAVDLRPRCTPSAAVTPEDTVTACRPSHTVSSHWSAY